MTFTKFAIGLLFLSSLSACNDHDAFPANSTAGAAADVGDIDIPTMLPVDDDETPRPSSTPSSTISEDEEPTQSATTAPEEEDESSTSSVSSEDDD